ncbi:MAG: CoA synthetase [Burkholderiales bacterium]|nr:CoA synthetase [Burkholderiales bacterium]
MAAAASASAVQAPARAEEIYANAIAGLLAGARSVAVGMLSPIPGAGALLAREVSAEAGAGAMRVTILGSREHNRFTNGGAELFDLAGRGRIDAFFLSGGQIDGQANINLVGTGEYPATEVRWSGSFGSGYLYFVVPRVILFRWEHSRRTLVPRVDFISAPGTSPGGVHRPGGPVALITNLCLFHFDRARGRFGLSSLHPGHTLEEVRDQTGFDFDVPEAVPTTALPDAVRLALLRGPVARQIAGVYPDFARQVFGEEAA